MKYFSLYICHRTFMLRRRLSCVFSIMYRDRALSSIRTQQWAAVSTTRGLHSAGFAGGQLSG